jgi:Antitoxin VbhA
VKGFCRVSDAAGCISKESNIDPETIAIAQRYVDGELTIDELAAAIEALLRRTA